MEILKRGLTKDFLNALSKAYNETPWWKSIVDDRELFVTPRKTCVCVYYRGNCLLKLELNGGKLIGKIHYKYLLNPSLKPEYCKVIDGKPELPNGAGGVGSFIANFSNLDLLKRASKPYAGDEKYGVSEIIAANPNIIDTEVAFSDPGDPDEPDDVPSEEPVDSKSRHNPRIDFVAVQQHRAELKLVFFEAKYFTNQELRSAKGKPRVVDQIKGYEKLLKNNETEILDAYKRHCDDLLNSNCVSGSREGRERHEFLSKVSTGQVIIDTKPRLVAFGFDDDQRIGPAWKPHKEKLEELLGKDRVLLRGNASGLVKGVRFREP